MIWVGILLFAANVIIVRDHLGIIVIIYEQESMGVSEPI